MFIIHTALFPLYCAIAWLRVLALRVKGATKDQYFIKPDYFPRKKYFHFDDLSNTDRYQDGVYHCIKDFVLERRLSSILDIGCGSGYKLMKYFAGYQTLGLELPPTLRFLRERYPSRYWALSDFAHPPQGEFDIAISVDVVEHLIDPHELMHFLQRVRCQYIAMSTPDRSRLGLRSRYRPTNPCHMREWSQQEFIEYVSSYFKILKSEIIDHHDHYLIASKQ